MADFLTNSLLYSNPFTAIPAAAFEILKAQEAKSRAQTQLQRSQAQEKSAAEKTQLQLEREKVRALEAEERARRAEEDLQVLQQGPPAAPNLPPAQPELRKPETPATSEDQRQFDKQMRELMEKLTSEEYLENVAARDFRNYALRSALGAQAAADRSRERTRREIEKQVLQSWQARETALINRDAQILAGMGALVGSVYPADALRRGADLLNTREINVPKVF